MPRRSSCGRQAAVSLSSSQMRPEVGSIIRLIIRSDVVLPQPDGPTNTVIWPDGRLDGRARPRRRCRRDTAWTQTRTGSSGSSPPPGRGRSRAAPADAPAEPRLGSRCGRRALLLVVDPVGRADQAHRAGDAARAARSGPRSPSRPAPPSTLRDISRRGNPTARARCRRRGPSGRPCGRPSRRAGPRGCPRPWRRRAPCRRDRARSRTPTHRSPRRCAAGTAPAIATRFCRPSGGGPELGQPRTRPEEAALVPRHELGGLQRAQQPQRGAGRKIDTAGALGQT